MTHARIHLSACNNGCSGDDKSDHVRLFLPPFFLAPNRQCDKLFFPSLLSAYFYGRLLLAIYFAPSFISFVCLIGRSLLSFFAGDDSAEREAIEREKGGKNGKRDKKAKILIAGLKKVG